MFDQDQIYLKYFRKTNDPPKLYTAHVYQGITN